MNVATVAPVERCPNCKKKAPCRVVPIVRYHSGYECSCGEVRWGGVIFAIGSRAIGFRFSEGAVICWRCAKKNAVAGDPIPRLPYLGGYMSTLFYPNDGDYKYDRCCDECGVLVNADC